METITFSTRMDKSLKEQMDRTCQALGLSTAAAFNIFARKFVAQGGFPFSVTLEVPTQEEFVREMNKRYDEMLAGHETSHELIEV